VRFSQFQASGGRDKGFWGEAAWTENRYKLLVSARRTELYDLVDDPKETRNIAPQNGQRVQAMMAKLHEWQRSVERSLSGADY
jgi:hypothetical protein